MNLQLFAVANHYLMGTDAGTGTKKKKDTNQPVAYYDPNSVVDYLKQQGQDSSYSARTNLAKEYNIQGYEGSGTQNTQLLNALKGGKPSLPALGTKPTATPKAEKKDTPKAESKEETKPVVDNTGAPAVTAPATVNGVDENIMQALNTPWSIPPAVQEAWSVTQSQLDSILSGRTSYTDQIRDMMSQIQNRDKFSYDVDTDMLFQQALASSMASGQQAMKDTIGQASSLTGGYASSYATSAGNQAYNAYIQDAYNNLPEYYQMALEAYNMEGQDMYNQLGMLADADATEYGRMYDAYNASASNYQTMYNEAYGAYQDNWSNNYNMASMQNTDYWSGMDEQYRRDAMENDNYWNGIDNTYRYDALESDDAYRRDALAQDDRHYRQDMLYKNNVNAQNQSNWEKEYALEEEMWNAENSATGDDEVPTLSTSEIDKLKTAYAQAGGGQAGLVKVDQMLTAMGKNSDNAEFAESLKGILADAELPIQYQDWQIEDDTKNKGFLWWKGVDHNDTYKYGDEVLTYDELAERIENSDLSETQKKQLLDNIKKQSTK